MIREFGFLITSFLFTIPWVAKAADLAFASPFTSSMVLQRDAPVVVHGRGTANGTVTVVFGPQRRSALVGVDGGWSVTFDPMPAGGPFVMDAHDGTVATQIQDVLVGDVWLCSGQSNMQMGLDEAEGGLEAIESATPQMRVRVLSVPKASAKMPQSTVDAEWKRTSADAIRKFSAVGWFFSKHLRQSPQWTEVPLGLIDSSFGGTAIEAWTPEGTLPGIPKERISGSMFGIPSAHLFNQMIAPLQAIRIKGVLWYQGEANAGAPEVYSQLLQNMMKQWRQGWHQPELPFFIVQLPAFEGRMGGLDFGWLREAQADACHRDDHAALAVTYDTADGFDLHPRSKEAIGRRLSLLARRDVYGENLVAHGPQFQKVEIAGERVTVHFDQVLAVSQGGPVQGFELAGSYGDYRYAKAQIAGSNVVLRADGIPAPKSVRFAWGGMPDANLVNPTGLPAMPFRTDTRKPQTLAFQPLQTVYRIETPSFALETGRGGSVSSLVVRGKQFLSHEPNGGTSIPGFFGPRNLAYLQRVGPQRLSLSDGGATLEVTVHDDDSMTWTLSHHGDKPIDLRIALAPQVEVKANGASAEVSRNGTTLRVEGIDRAEDGPQLMARAPAHGSVDVRWKLISR